MGVSHTLRLALSVILFIVAGCDQSAIPPNANLLGMEQLTFHCVDLSQTPVKTAPLERCGCIETSLDDTGARRLAETGEQQRLDRTSLIADHMDGDGTRASICALRHTHVRTLTSPWLPSALS